MESTGISENAFTVVSDFIAKCRPGVRNMILSALGSLSSKNNIEAMSGRLIEIGLASIADDGESSRAIASPAWLVGDFAPDFVAFVSVLPQFMDLNPQARVQLQRRLSQLNSTVPGPPYGAEHHFMVRSTDSPFWEFYNKASVVNAFILRLDFSERRYAISYLAARETRSAEDMTYVIRDFVGCQIGDPAGPYVQWNLDRELWLHPSLAAFLEAVDFLTTCPTPQLRHVLARAQQELHHPVPSGPWTPLVRLSSDVEESGSLLPESRGGYHNDEFPYDGPIIGRPGGDRMDEEGGGMAESKAAEPVEEAKTPEVRDGFSHPILRDLGSQPLPPRMAVDVMASSVTMDEDRRRQMETLAPNATWFQTVYVLDDGQPLPGVAWAHQSDVVRVGSLNFWVPEGGGVHIAFERVDLTRRRATDNVEA